MQWQAKLRFSFDWVRHYFKNRFFDGTHLLRSRSLRKGEFHEFDTRLLHCAFDELCEFVEGEMAHLHFILKEMPGSFQKSRDLGLARLDEEALILDDDGNLCDQAKAAQELKTLYLWWRDQRPERQAILDCASDMYTLDRFIDLEKAAYAEDEAMLLRLVKLAKYVWT